TGPPHRAGRSRPSSAGGCRADPARAPRTATSPTVRSRGVATVSGPERDEAQPLPLVPLTLEHAVAVVGNQQQRAQGPNHDEEEVPGARVAGEIEELNQGRNHQPPALWALVTSSRFSAMITRAVKPNRTAKATTVPMMFLSCWRLMAWWCTAATSGSSGPAG